LSQASSARKKSDATRWNSAAFKAAGGVALAASPTFGIMALLTSGAGGDPAAMLCSAPHASC
jgi:hypothetical protein